MNKDIKIAGATYSGVPAIKIPTVEGGTASYTEISDTTATAADVARGKVFYDASGNKAIGTDSPCNMLFTDGQINLTDDDLPESDAGALTMYFAIQNIVSINSKKIKELAKNLFASSNANNTLLGITLPYTSKIGDSCFLNCKALTTAIMPKLETIPQDAFYSCPKLEKCDFSSVKTLGLHAFTEAGAQADKSIFTFPAVEAITESVFYHFGSSKTRKTILKLPAIKQMLSSSANLYMYCVDLGPNLSKVGDSFIGGSFLSKVVIRAKTPPETASSTIFGPLTKGAKIYVPDDSLETYKTATNWSNYASYYAPLSEYVEDAT